MDNSLFSSASDICFIENCDWLSFGNIFCLLVLRIIPFSISTITEDISLTSIFSWGSAQSYNHYIGSRVASWIHKVHKISLLLAQVLFYHDKRS